MKKHQRFLAVACAFIMAAFLNGCANFSIIPPQYVGQERPNYGNIGVVAARFQPQVKVDILTLGKGAGGAKVAGKWMLAGEYLGKYCSASVSLYAPAVLMCLAIAVPSGAAVGAIQSASGTERNARIAAEEAAMKIRLEDLKLQELIRDKVVEYAQEVELTGFSTLKDQGPEDLKALPVYRPAPGEHVDTVVELSVVSLETETIEGKNFPSRLRWSFVSG